MAAMEKAVLGEALGADRNHVPVPVRHRVAPNVLLHDDMAARP
ncbi:DUF6653 family protein [Pseudonocardia cypriaca]|uniref:Uncharacterized protein n=1 Tax=Pseudonocardia cypriaca TaxID=882449 RepID=A0A543FSN9_9PSEU|nr:DUF6653 family protein [Pseudonocardia cypriaca]TQM36858.1 hypothetical protein FB388_4045 [Pseudonocardia cypriaca]